MKIKPNKVIHKLSTIYSQVIHKLSTGYSQVKLLINQHLNVFNGFYYYYYYNIFLNTLNIMVNTLNIQVTLISGNLKLR